MTEISTITDQNTCKFVLLNISLHMYLMNGLTHFITLLSYHFCLRYYFPISISILYFIIDYDDLVYDL